MGLVIEEATPLNLQSLEEEKNPKFETSIWVHQNIIRLEKEFGIHFQGCEREALKFFMKIDNKRQENKGFQICKCQKLLGENGLKTKGVGNRKRLQKQWYLK